MRTKPVCPSRWRTFTQPGAVVVAGEDALSAISSSTFCSARNTTAAPGWVKVRHRDGQTGYVRLAQVFGL